MFDKFFEALVLGRLVAEFFQYSLLVSFGNLDFSFVSSNIPQQLSDLSIKDPKTGKWIEKKGVSTMFPKHWSRARVLKEIRSAMNNGKIQGTRWTGISRSGVKIRGYLDKKGNIDSAHPL